MGIIYTHGVLARSQTPKLNYLPERTFSKRNMESAWPGARGKIELRFAILAALNLPHAETHRVVVEVNLHSHSACVRETVCDCFSMCCVRQRETVCDCFDSLASRIDLFFFLSRAKFSTTLLTACKPCWKTTDFTVSAMLTSAFRDTKKAHFVSV